MKEVFHMATTKTTKKLNISTLKQAHDKAFTQRKLTFDIEGKTYTCLVDEKFSIIKIKDMIMDLCEVYKTFIDMKDVWSLPLYTNFLLLKYFTDLDLNDLSYEQSIMTIKYLDDFECLETIMNAFDENEVLKFNKYMKKATENVKKLANNPEAMKEIKDVFTDIVKDLPDEESPMQQVETVEIPVNEDKKV